MTKSKNHWEQQLKGKYLTELNEAFLADTNYSHNLQSHTFYIII